MSERRQTRKIESSAIFFWGSELREERGEFCLNRGESQRYNAVPLLYMRIGRVVS